MVDRFRLKADSIPIFLERVKALLSRDHLSQDELSSSGYDIVPES